MMISVDLKKNDFISRNTSFLVFAVGRRKTTSRLFGRSPKIDRLFDFFRPTFFREDIWESHAEKCKEHFKN